MHPREASRRVDSDPIQHLENVDAALAKVASETDRTERLATLGMLAACVAHEIRNLLTPALAYSQMAANRPDDADIVEKAIHKTIAGIESATRIADAILGFSGDSDASTADVAAVIQESLACLAYDPNKTRTNIRVEAQAGTLVRMNPLSLQQVLLNLILNAQAAMRQSPAGSRQSSEDTLTIAAITRADGTVGIRVTDTGPGIPAEIAGRIFEPFVTSKRGQPARAPQDHAVEPGGNGLGLSICKRLVEQAGGSITAASTAGRGTTFLIVLPSLRQIRAKAV